MKVIGIAGYARAGKDTFVAIAKNILKKNGYSAERKAFADKLKDEVQSMLDAYKFKYDIRSENPDDKAKNRPLLVWWGCARRYLCPDGMYWVDTLDKELEDIFAGYMQNSQSTERVVILVSDVRFPNESAWVHNDWKGWVVHLRRYKMMPYIDTLSGDTRDIYERSGFGDEAEQKPTQVFDPAPNEEEAKQDPLVRAQADYLLDWESKGIPTGSDATQDPYLQSKVLETLNASKFFNGTLTL